MLWADNTAAQRLLQSSGYRSVKHVSGQDSGCCEVLAHGTTAAGGEEFRWALA